MNASPSISSGRDLDQPVSGNLQVNNGITARQMTLAGVGLSRLGLFHVAADIAAGTLVPVLEKYNPGDLEMINAVYVGGGHVPRRVKAFIDHLAENLKNAPLLFLERKRAESPAFRP
jgi:DNA-binding transcriptional LysR family regulator